MQAFRPALLIAAIYGVAGLLWIFLSDALLAGLAGENAAELTRYQTLKGSAFVLATALLVYWLVVRALRRQAEAERSLRDSEARFRAIFDHALDGIALAGTEDKRFVIANASFLRMTGYSPEEMPGLGISAIHPAADLPHVVAQFERQARREIVLARDIPVLRKDGSVFQADVNSWPVTVGGKSYLLGVFRDVTERNRTEDQLRKLFLAVEQSPESIVITDLEPRIEYVNAAFTRVSGYSREEALGRNPNMLQSGQTSAETHRGLWAALVAGDIWQGELINKRKNGEIYTEWASISPVRQPDGRITHYLAVKSDITERKRMDAELARHRDHLEELVNERTAALARANRELESFSYSISHDLRAPLRAINGFAQILIEDRRDSWKDEDRNHLDRIVLASNRMGQLIDDILEFSRISRAEFEMAAVDMGGLAQACLHDLAADYPAAQVDIGGLPAATGDAAALRQVFANLIGNALKYSSKKDSPRIEIGAREAEGETVYFVRDNGAGFNMEYAQRLFGVFQRVHTDAEFPGTGVGLAIVKNIVERHGGRVWAEAAKDEGATFHFTLDGR
ncbi:MAG: PAS domain S-box protein [Rhodocyclales bacterium]|nr:PAS domain S-box protein [Rhodocyclales bacterium]